ncbi:mitochondrial inner-membrane-bound regulator-domain-containing protein [Xylariales sp. AK1849]|nr:mitochondrial inner-membrane-bound regulator-domain-containing protein [Xylariales sp. AK1849]
MIARGVSSGATCLGCRLRLFRQAARPNRRQSLSPSPDLYRRQSQRWFASEGVAHASGFEKLFDEGEKHEHQLRQVLQFEDDEPILDFDELPNSSGYGATRQQPRGSKEEHFRSVKRLAIRKKQYFSGRKILTESSESLGSDMLGKPAYAIVMRDGGVYQKRKNVGANDTAGDMEERKLLDIEAILDSQLKPPTNSEVRDNINELRPESEIYLPVKEFRRIQHALEEGFLKSQLSDYIESFKANNGANTSTSAASESTSDPYDTEDLVLKYKWIKKLSPWIPLGADGEAITETTDRHLHGYLTPSAGPKERLAVRVMRECWGLQMEELMSGLGEVKITLRSHEFILLMRGTRRFLKLLNDMYMEPGETIEAIRSKTLIRIVATRPKSQTIINELDATLERISTKTFPVSNVTSDPSKITEALLEEVGRITNTHARLSETGKRIHVTWLQVRKSQFTEVEDLRHVVSRLLHTALQPEHRSEKLHAPIPSPGGAEGRYYVDQYNKEKWVWRDKLEQWARYVLPLPSQTFTEPEESLASEEVFVEGQRSNVDGPFQELDTPLERPGSQKKPFTTPSLTGATGGSAGESTSFPVTGGMTLLEGSRFPYQPVRWSPDLTTTTTTIFGHVLHSHPPHGTPPPLSDLLKATERPRIFSPVVPHPMQLANLLQPDSDKPAPSPVTSTILIRFRPNPVSAGSLRSHNRIAPMLELRLSLSDPDSVSEDPSVTGIHSLRAITAVSINDVLQPSHPVDMRVTQTRFANLQGSAADLGHWQPIADFLLYARLDFHKGKLEMPPQQRFQIPLHLMTDLRSPNNKQKIEHSQEDLSESSINDPWSMLYDFAGLELHRSIDVPHPDNETLALTYTSIEAGQGGGRRAELSLRPVHIKAPATASSSFEGRSGSHNMAGSESNSSINKESTESLIEENEDVTRPRDGSNNREAVANSDKALHDEYLNACYKFARMASHWTGFMTSRSNFRRP